MNAYIQFIFLSCGWSVLYLVMMFPRYTYGQPVPGQVLVEVCREPFPYVVAPELTRWCLNQTAEVCDSCLTVDGFSFACA